MDTMKRKAESHEELIIEWTNEWSTLIEPGDYYSKERLVSIDKWNQRFDTIAKWLEEFPDPNLIQIVEKAVENHYYLNGV